MMKKAFSFRSQKPPLRVRQDFTAGKPREGRRSCAKTDKFQKSEKGGSVLCNFRYGAAAMQGFRSHMQDDFACSPSESVKGDAFGYFAVFDGHGRHGHIVSQYCTENFLKELLNRKTVKSCRSLTTAILVPALKKTCIKFDEQLKEAARTYISPVAGEEGISFVFSGTTATMALVLDKHIVVANTGDSRTILCSRGGIRFSSVDHNPGDKVEDKRIIAAGGKVHTTPSKNKVILDPEAYTNLAVSRTLGDYGFKKSPTLPAEEQIVSPVPDVEVIAREFGTDEFLVLASDGIFKSMSSSDAVAFVQQRMLVTDDLASICRELIEMAYYSPEITPDDTTVVIVKFSAAPSVSNTAKYEEQALTAEALRLIREEVDGVVAAAEAKWVLDNDYNIIQRLVAKLPKKYLIQLRTDFIKKLIAEGKNHRFGDENEGSNKKSHSNSEVNKEPVEEEVEDSPDEAGVPITDTDAIVLHFTDTPGSKMATNSNKGETGGASEQNSIEESFSSRSPSLLIKPGKGAHPSPLLAELGKAMLKRKTSESESKAKTGEAKTPSIAEQKSEVDNTLTFTASYKSDSKEKNGTDTEISIEVKATAEDMDQKLHEIKSDVKEAITLTPLDSTAVKAKPDVEDTSQSDEHDTMVSVSIDVNSDKAEVKVHGSGGGSVRNSKAVSEGCDNLDSDIDTGLDYMYDSDEKTTIL